MSIAAKLPGMKPGSTARNLGVGVLYVVTMPLWLFVFPFIVGLFVWRNIYGWAETLDALPGIGSEGGLVAGALAFVYIVVIFAVLGAAFGGGGDGGEQATASTDGGAAAPATNTQSSTATPDVTATVTPTAVATTTPDPISTPTPTPTETPTPTPTPTAIPTPTSTPTGIDASERTQLPSVTAADDYYDEDHESLSGDGQSVTDSFQFDGGLMVLDYEHEGDSNFQVEVYNGDGERVAIPINKIGTVDGTTAIPLPPGEYSLDVNANDDWNINVAQPQAPAEERHAPPATASGSGPDVVGPIRLDGSIVVTASHSGESNFQVILYNEDSESDLDGTYVYNEIGEVDEAQTRVTHNGVAWVVVEADGDWELEFEE